MSQVKYAKLFKCSNGGINISDIPEEILSKIMSYCTVRDAVNTSMLSRIWRRVSFSMSVLSFNLKSMCQMGHKDSVIAPHCYGCTRLMNNSCEEYKERFVRWVNQFIENHEGPRLVSLRVEFCLGRDNACDIDRWVTTAVSLGAEQIALLFSCTRNTREHWKKIDLKKLYFFRFDLLYEAEAPKLEYLALHSCALELGRINQFSCLKKLYLCEVPLGYGEVESIVSCFTNLEHWTMMKCLLPDKLHIPSSHKRLKFLSIIRCVGAKDIDVSANGLTSFEHYGKRVQYSFYPVPSLRKVYIGAFDLFESADKGTYNFQTWANFPFVETLSIFTKTDPVGRLPICTTQFTNLKELEFFARVDVVVTYPKIIEILQSCPLLEKFNLASFCENLCAQPFQHIHSNLKEICISYYHANESSIKLALSLLDYAPSLERMVLNMQRKVYLGAGRWEVCNQHIPISEESYRAKIMSRLRDHPKSSVVVVKMG